MKMQTVSDIANQSQEFDNSSSLIQKALAIMQKAAQENIYSKQTK